jgi:hypothetical protein
MSVPDLAIAPPPGAATTRTTPRRRAADVPEETWTTL